MALNFILWRWSSPQRFPGVEILTVASNDRALCLSELIPLYQTLVVYRCPPSNILNIHQNITPYYQLMLLHQQHFFYFVGIDLYQGADSDRLVCDWLAVVG